VVRYSLGSSTTQRGVTVALTRVAVRPNAPAELGMRFVNWAKNRPDLDLDSGRVVVRQAGRRVSARSGPGHVLTWGGSATGIVVQLTGFRPHLPFTVTATVVCPMKHAPIGWQRALRFHWWFANGAG
jgi:hypothetical protein